MQKSPRTKSFWKISLASSNLVQVALQVTAEELITLVANNLEDHKHLRSGVHFLDNIPHTDTGKIARKQLKEMAKRFVLDYVPAEYTK